MMSFESKENYVSVYKTNSQVTTQNTRLFTYSAVLKVVVGAAQGDK